MTVWCGYCNKQFASQQYFRLHINAESNVDCLSYFCNGLRGRSSSSTGTPGEKALKRRRLIQRREAILRGLELQLEPKIGGSGKKQGNYSVFDFEDDCVQEESFPYVRELKNPPTGTTRRTSSASASAFGRNGGELDNQEEDPLNNGSTGLNEEEEAFTETEGNELLNQGKEGLMYDEEANLAVVPSEIDQFREYVKEATLEQGNFTDEMVAAVELMDEMNRKGGSLELYESISQWHIRNSEVSESISAKKLHEFLVKRYNLERTFPVEKQVQLPCSKETINLATHDILKETVDLLTDIRIEDDDWLFFEDDPLAAPPETTDTVGDINTGRAYRETYKAKIEPEPYTACGRRRVLLPYIFYLDGCVTGNFQNMSIEILKFTIGLFKGKTRNKAWAWRVAGFVKKLVVKKKKAEEFIRQSGHSDANNVLSPVGYQSRKHAVEEDTTQFDASMYGSAEEDIPDIKPQDFHKMLQVLLSSFKTVQDAGGFPWDFPQRGELKKLWLVPFVLFVKADSVEADKFCGTYGAKTKGVQCYCRVCTCPAKDSDFPYPVQPWEKKTPKMVMDLVTANTVESRAKLKEIAQNDIWNAMYELDFGSHDETGIHGASPWDLLHTV